MNIIRRKNRVRIGIIHYQPIELYPPIMNFLNYMSENNLPVHVFTTNKKGIEKFKRENIQIYRFSDLGKNKSRFINSIKYLYYNMSVILQILICNCNKLMYYDPYSAFPAYIYTKYIKRSAKLLIHYHEYFTPQWFSNGMALVKINHSLEQKYLYRKASWISHTNRDRIDLFLKDYYFIDPGVVYELPNFPPKSWIKQKTNNPNSENSSLRCVYIGSLGKNSYIKNFCSWVSNLNGRITLDVFSNNSTDEVKQFLKDLNNPYINFFFFFIGYYDLPDVLKNYEVGLILYNVA